MAIVKISINLCRFIRYIRGSDIAAKWSAIVILGLSLTPSLGNIATFTMTLPSKLHCSTSYNQWSLPSSILVVMYYIYMLLPWTSRISQRNILLIWNVHYQLAKLIITYRSTEIINQFPILSSERIPISGVERCQHHRGDYSWYEWQNFRSKWCLFKHSGLYTRRTPIRTNQFSRKDTTRIYGTKCSCNSKTQGVCKLFEKEYIPKDATRVSVLLRLALLENNLEQVIGYIVNVSKRKQTEELLSQ